MKKVLLLLSLLIAVSLNAQEDAVTASSLHLRLSPADSPTSVTLELYLSTPDTSVGALELYITPPADGCTLSDGTLNGDVCSDTHILTQGMVDGRLFVSIVSPELDAFTSSDAPLCTWQCDLSTLADGSYTIDATGKFAIGIVDNDIVCYTSPSQQESIKISSGIITSIDRVSSESDTPLVIYDLRGNRLCTPRKGAINIINGKKIKL